MNKNILKRTLAGVLAILCVAGTLPANVDGGGLFDTAILAKAAPNTIDLGTEFGTTTLSSGQFYVNGVDVATGTLPNGCSFDADNNTLTLNGANITQCEKECGIYYEGNSPFNIVLVGDNTIDITSANGNAGIFASSLINISGTGKLTVKGKSHGIVGGNGVNFNGGTVDVEAEGYAVSGGNGNIIIGNATVTAAATDTDYAIALNGNVINSIAGKGWTNAAGTEGEAAIEVNTTGRDLSDYKKVQFIVPVTYMVWNDETKQLEKQTLADSITPTTVTTETTTWGTAGEQTWYVVSETTTISERITVNGEVNLILTDGATLTASKGINVPSTATLNIYAQSGGTGALTATGDGMYAGIGGNGNLNLNTGETCGAVNIFGGTITANSGTNAAGIGGGCGKNGGSGGTVTIYGGTVHATGGPFGAGIGGGCGSSSNGGNGGTMTVYNGTVTATGGIYAAGIGGAYGTVKSGDGSAVTVNGGTVTATGGTGGAGIGGGKSALEQGTVTINNGLSVKAGNSANPTTDVTSTFENNHDYRYVKIDYPEVKTNQPIVIKDGAKFKVDGAINRIYLNEVDVGLSSTINTDSSTVFSASLADNGHLQITTSDGSFTKDLGEWSDNSAKTYHVGYSDASGGQMFLYENKVYKSRTVNVGYLRMGDIVAKTASLMFETGYYNVKIDDDTISSPYNLADYSFTGNNNAIIVTDYVWTDYDGVSYFFNQTHIDLAGNITADEGITVTKGGNTLEGDALKNVEGAVVFTADKFFVVTSGTTQIPATLDTSATPNKYKVTYTMSGDAQAYFAPVEVKTGSTYTYYKTLNEAVAAAQSSATITLLGDVTGDFEIAADKNFTLDLNGKTITANTITNNGIVTIKDGSEEKTGTIKARTFSNDKNASLTVESGIFYCVFYTSAIENAKIIIKDGAFKNSITVYNDKIEIKGGVFGNWAVPQSSYIAGGKKLVALARNQGYGYGVIDAPEFTVSATPVSPITYDGTKTYTLSASTQTNTLTANGTTYDIAYTYQWQKKADSDTYTNIEGATSATYTTGTDVEDSGTYRCVVTSKDFTAEPTATVTINKAGITPTVSIEGWTYGETAKTPSVSENSNPGNGDVTYEYKVKGAGDDTYSATAPTNAGNYTVRATIAQTTNYNGGTATADFTINKAPALKTAPTAKNPTRYSSAVQLINAGTVKDGCTIEYQLGTSSTTAPTGAWTTNAASITANSSGTYYVWYKVTGNANYADVDATPVTVKVTQGYYSQSWTLTMDSYEYDGTAHTPTINGMTYGTVTYKYYNVDTNTSLTEAPSEVGNYRVTVTASGSGNYSGLVRQATYSITEPPKPATYTVTVIGGTVNGETSGEFAPNTVIAAKADTAPAGKKFGYWKRNGMTASYNSVYTFPVTSDNIELEAVYLDADDEFSTDGKCVKDSVAIDATNKKISFSFLNNVPEDCTIVKGGVVATSDINKVNTLALGNADFEKIFTTTKHNYKYTWTKSNVADGQAWYVKGYLIYKDADGVEHTVYSNMEKATLNGSETIWEDKVVGTTSMDSVSVDKANNKIAFAALLNVPADCTIKFAGVVATSDASKVDAMTKITATEKTIVDGIYVRGIPSTKHTVKYTWTKTNIGAETWYVRPYLVYTDSLGTEQIVFGDVTNAKLS